MATKEVILAIVILKALSKQVKDEDKLLSRLLMYTAERLEAYLS